MLSAKQSGIKYHFWVFGMTQPRIEPQSPRPLANTLLVGPTSQSPFIFKPLNSSFVLSLSSSLQHKKEDPLVFRWSNPSATCQIYLYVLEHDPRIYHFMPTCLIIDILMSRGKFLEWSIFCSLIWCPFTIRTTIIFGCFISIMAHDKLIKHKFPN